MTMERHEIVRREPGGGHLLIRGSARARLQRWTRAWPGQILGGPCTGSRTTSGAAPSTQGGQAISEATEATPWRSVLTRVNGKAPGSETGAVMRTDGGEHGRHQGSQATRARTGAIWMETAGMAPAGKLAEKSAHGAERLWSRRGGSPTRPTGAQRWRDCSSASINVPEA